MPKTKKRTIGIEAVNDIRAAHGRLLRCLEHPGSSVTAEDLEEAEFLLRCALARMGITTRGRRVAVAIGGSE